MNAIYNILINIAVNLFAIIRLNETYVRRLVPIASARCLRVFFFDVYIYRARLLYVHWVTATNYIYFAREFQDEIIPSVNVSNWKVAVRPYLNRASSSAIKYCRCLRKILNKCEMTFVSACLCAVTHCCFKLNKKKWEKKHFMLMLL